MASVVDQQAVEVEPPTNIFGKDGDALVSSRDESSSAALLREEGDRYAHLNPGIDLDLTWVADVRSNKSGIDRRAGEIAGRRSIKKKWQSAWLLRAVTCNFSLGPPPLPARTRFMRPYLRACTTLTTNVLAMK